MNDLGISHLTRTKSTLLLLKTLKLLLFLLQEVYKYNWFQINNIINKNFKLPYTQKS